MLTPQKIRISGSYSHIKNLTQIVLSYADSLTFDDPDLLQLDACLDMSYKFQTAIKSRKPNKQYNKSITLYQAEILKKAFMYYKQTYNEISNLSTIRNSLKGLITQIRIVNNTIINYKTLKAS